MRKKIHNVANNIPFFHVFQTASSLSHCITSSQAPSISATRPKPSSAPENRVPIFRKRPPFSRGSTPGHSARAVARSRSTKKSSSSRPPSQFTPIGTKPGSGHTSVGKLFKLDSLSLGGTGGGAAASAGLPPDNIQFQFQSQFRLSVKPQSRR